MGGRDSNVVKGATVQQWCGDTKLFLGATLSGARRKEQRKEKKRKEGGNCLLDCHLRKLMVRKSKSKSPKETWLICLEAAGFEVVLGASAASRHLHGAGVACGIEPPESAMRYVKGACSRH